ncbi:hypothetical protein ACEYW6_10535 [Nostoc sp. UIC 10607]|uniref:hypothetical protein n=1 Tax=Nostoc sp. UIC 10607 TaxID=3045935 RepID=UPI0039A25C3D
MRQKRVIEEVKELIAQEDTTIEAEVLQSETVEESSEFKAEYDADTGIVTFELTDGTPVSMKSPKTRQFLLLESFLNSAEPEYKTESFLALKLSALCIIKYGKNTSISFDNLIDNLELQDMERLAAGLAFFQDKLEYLSKAAIH